MQFKNEVEEPNVTVEFSTPVSACLVTSVYFTYCSLQKQPLLLAIPL